jgi:transcription elongation factor GreA
MNKILTEQAFKKLKDELEYLKKEKLLELAKQIAEAKELGDLSENAEYQEAKDEQGLVAKKINELEEIVRTATITSTDNINTTIVEIGNSLVVETDKIKYNFTIVSSNEVNPSQGEISNESPLGQAFLGRKKGDIVEVVVPRGRITYKILEIK